MNETSLQDACKNRNIMEECIFEEGRGIDYYAYRIAALLSIRGPGGSAYKYTKEIREAIERVINELDWLPDSDAWLKLITQSEAPTDIIRCKEEALCLLNLFETLLRKFRDDALKLPPGMRQVYANILIASVERMARFTKNLPKEALVFRKCFSGLCGESKSPSRNIGGEE